MSEQTISVNLGGESTVETPTDSGVTAAELKDLKKQIAELQQRLAIAEHTAKVTGENLDRTQKDAMSLRATCVELQSHVFTLCKALGKAMT